MRPLDIIRHWPLASQPQLDPLGRAAAAQSPRSRDLRARTHDAEVTRSICPYCAVGCGQRVFVKDGEVTQIEGDPDCPISRGRLCPKGSASKQLVTGPTREYQVQYRRPHGTEWEELDLDTGDGHDRRPRDRRPATRRWEDDDDDGQRAAPHARHRAASAARRSTTRRTTSSRSCSPRSARSRSRTRRAYDTPPPSPVWGPRSAAAAPPTFQQDLQNADCIVIEGSNMAECHPVGFQWVMEAQGARRDGHPRRPALHPHERASPTCTCRPGRHATSPSSAGSSTTSSRTSATSASTSWPTRTPPTIIDEDFRDTEDLDGLFSGCDPETRTYDTDTWQYEGMEAHAVGRAARAAARTTGEQAATAAHGARRSSTASRPRTDPTLQHPRCVFQS